VEFATEPNHTLTPGHRVFHPYLRDAETLARPWAIPGTAGLEHRIGGIEKADVTGNISYDPDNHDRMTRLRQAKVDGVTVPDLEVDDPSASARVLVLGWGSTYGPIAAAVRAARKAGHAVARRPPAPPQPVPGNLGEVLALIRRVIVPEMNLGQLALLLRAKYLVDVRSHTAVRGLPFKTTELADVITDGDRGAREDRPGMPQRWPSAWPSCPLDRRRQADQEGLHLRPGGALVPGLR
jgi:2-oxoglutarate ferredoxin oxidoreductase subunit alpha